MAELILYKKCKINPNENFILKEYFGHNAIEEYLGTLSSLSFSDIRFTQNKLDIEVIVKLSRDDSDMANRSEYNYVSLYEKTGATIFYYFITKMAQISSQSVKLYLHLDVLNSFAPTKASGEFGFLKFSKLTHITRQHKNRFKQYYIYGQGNYWYPYIDEYSEGLNPVLYKKEEKTIYSEDNSQESYDRNFYLIIKKISNTSNPVVFYLTIGYDDPPLKIGVTSGGGATYRYMQPNTIFPNYDPTIIKILKLPYMPCTPIRYEEDDGVLCPILSNDEWYWDTNGILARNNPRETYPMCNGIFNSNPNQLGTISDNLLELNPLGNKNMNNNVVPKNLGELRETNRQFVWEEPKLFHSDFFYWKYIYDSFTKPIANEKYLNTLFTTDSYDIEYNQKINFGVTSTINSRFMFEFNFLYNFNFNNEDYERFLIVQRSNEVTILSDDYINYIKTGFNYDVKNKNRQEAYSWFTTGLGITAGIASVLFGSKTLGVAMISSSVLSIASSINNTIQLETNMEQKINQLKHQSSAVYGADDVDLMTIYNKNNKLWRAKYEVSDRMKNALSDLFYYTGYVEDVCEVPNVNTRMWFNFLQCEPHFDYVNNISAECLEELINKYKGGVTYLHMNTINSVKTWDFERTHENWESVFFS